MRTLAVGVVVALVVACGGGIEGATTMGEACTPSIQTNAGFSGFSANDVNLETGAKACPSQVCLVNHFRGKVGAPYGGSGIAAQCADRTEKQAVYCSCRCANNGGRTDDGSVYCTCADGFACTHLVTSIGPSTDSFAGSYCVKTGTEYVRTTACAETCDPQTHPCP